MCRCDVMQLEYMSIVNFDAVVILLQIFRCVSTYPGWLVGFTNTFRFPLRRCLPIEIGFFIEVDKLEQSALLPVSGIFKLDNLFSFRRACYGSVAVLALSRSPTAAAPKGPRKTRSLEIREGYKKVLSMP